MLGVLSTMTLGGLAGCGGDGDDTDTPTEGNGNGNGNGNGDGTTTGDTDTSTGTEPGGTATDTPEDTPTDTPEGTPTETAGQDLGDSPAELLRIEGGSVRSGETTTLSGTLENPYLFDVRNVEVTMNVPNDDWTLSPTGDTSFDSIESGGSRDVGWEVTIPEDADGEFTIEGSVVYESNTDSADVSVSVSVNVFNLQEGQTTWSAADYDVDATPEDSWEPQNAVDTWSIQQDDDGQYLAFGGPNQQRSTLRFTGADQALNVEVQATLKSATAADDNWIYVRGSNEDDPNGLTQARFNDYISEGSFRLGVYSNGELTTGLATMDRLGEAGDLYHVRARYEEETWQVKVWLDGEDEPEDWQMEIEPDVADPGFVGAGHWVDAPMQIYQFNVGTGSQEAPPVG